MTINLSDNTPRVSYNVADGVTQSSFTVSFEFYDDADLNVYVDGTLKTLTTDYTVTGGDGATGSITMSVTGASGGSTVVVTREIDLKRTTDFPSSGAFQIGSLNTELDKFIAIAADIDDEVGRSLRLTDYDAAANLTLPDKDSRKGKVLAFNATTGAVESGPSIADTQAVADASADIATLADIEDGTDATDAIQTVAGISGNVTTVAGVSANVTTVAGISSDVTSVAGDEADIGTVAGSISNVNTVAGINSDVTTVAGISANVTTVAGDSADIQSLAAKTTELSLLGTADAIADMNTLATSAIVTDMDALADLNTELDALGDVTADITTVAGISSDVSTVATNNANVTTVASNISGVNSFADRYRVGSADPTTSLDEGDLAYNSTTNALKYYNGTSWESITAGISEVSDDTTPQLGGDLTLGGFDITGTGDIDVTGTVTSDGLTVDTDTLHVDATNNRVGINTSSPARDLEVTGGTQGLLRVSGTTNGGAIECFDGTNGNYFGSAPVVLGTGSSGDLVVLTDGSTQQFYTSGSERMRVTDSGITFNGDTAQANALDDYEEGTWTPVFADAASGGNTSSSTADSAKYVKIGSFVHVSFLASNISTSGLTSGNSFYVQGLPFTANGESVGSAWTQLFDFGTGTVMLAPRTFNNVSYIRFDEVHDNSNDATIDVGDLSNGSADINVTLTYTTSS